MYSLCRQKVIFSTFALFLGVIKVYSQGRTKFQPDYDNKKVHFGYYLGFANTNYVLKYSRAFINAANGNKVAAVTSPTSTGIKAGAIVNIQLNDYIDFRFSPLAVSIYARKLLESDSIQHNQVDKAWFEIPMMLKYKSERRHNSRMFMFTGLKYGFETNVFNKSSINVVTTKTADLSFEYGFGLELFREYFKLTPEIHFSHGMRNMLNPFIPASNFLYNVDKMKTHSVSFFIVFQ